MKNKIPEEYITFYKWCTKNNISYYSELKRAKRGNYETLLIGKTLYIKTNTLAIQEKISTNVRKHKDCPEGYQHLTEYCERHNLNPDSIRSQIYRNNIVDFVRINHNLYIKSDADIRLLTAAEGGLKRRKPDTCVRCYNRNYANLRRNKPHKPLKEIHKEIPEGYLSKWQYKKKYKVTTQELKLLIESNLVETKNVCPFRIAIKDIAP